MSREIVEAVRELERDRNLEGGILVDALRDELLAAYKKTPGSYRHATVEIDDAGDFRVFFDPHAGGSGGAPARGGQERTYDELREIEEETGEKQHTLVTDDDLEIDWDQVPENEVRREDVTPENFGRIAAQTASGSSSSGSARPSARSCTRSTSTASAKSSLASSSRPATATTSSSTSARSKRCCRAPSRWTASATGRGSRIKAVITEVGQGRRGRR